MYVCVFMDLEIFGTRWRTNKMGRGKLKKARGKIKKIDKPQPPPQKYLAQPFPLTSPTFGICHSCNHNAIGGERGSFERFCVSLSVSFTYTLFWFLWWTQNRTPHGHKIYSKNSTSLLLVVQGKHMIFTCTHPHTHARACTSNNW